MFKLKIPAGVTFRQASIPKLYPNIRIINGTDEQIYDKMYVTGIVNERLVKFLKESVKYD